MNPDSAIEAFVSVIIILVVGVVVVTILAPEFGMALIDILPQFVELAVWIFIVVFVILVISEALD
jgi:tellurite resistance protein TehA-like permease